METEYEKPLVLVVDDGPTNLRILVSKLNREYRLGVAKSGTKALEYMGKQIPDLVLLDVMMPDMDGYAVCEHIKRDPRLCDIPVVFISYVDDPSQKTRGFEVGGVDYITKPFNPSELVARVKSQLRRYTQLGAMQTTEKQIVIRGLVLDTESKTVTVDGEPVRMTPLEYKILELLCRHPGKVFSTEEIYRQVWNDEIVSDNAIAVHVRHIREKIEINPREPRYLKVVWGGGYKIERSE